MYKKFTKFFCTPPGYINKFLLVTKLTTVLLIVTLVQVSAAGLAQKINYTQKNATLRQVFDQIYKQTGYSILWTSQNIKLDRTINASFHEASTDEVLKKCLDDQNLTYTIEDKTIVIKEVEPLHAAATKSADVFTVQGKVTDSLNQPLPGVTVRIKGTNIATTTDINGVFKISNPDKNAVLVFTYVSFATKEVPFDGNNSITVKLMPAALGLHETVVTALGIKKEKRAVGFAVQEVKGAALEKAREPNVIAGLTGKVAGLTIYNTSTLFENQTMKLRGLSTLIVIDGIITQGDSWNLNPDDIDNITVLKGPAAALLYGAPGANGAVQITTKKGKSGANGVEVSVNSTNQLQIGALNTPKTQTQYGMGWNGLYAFIDGQGGGGWYDNYGYVWGPKLNQKDPSTPSGFVEIPQYNSPYDPNQLFTFNEAGYTDQSHYKPMPWITKGQNNLQDFLRNELLSTTNVSVAGKTDKADYRISLSEMYQKGQVPNTKLNSTTLALSGGIKISDKVRADANLSYNRQYTPNYPTSGYGPSNYFYNILLWMGPDVNINDLKNYWQPGKAGQQQFTYNYSWYNNPWYLANENLRGYTNDVAIGQASITYDIAKDLSFLLRSGGTINGSASDLKTPYSFIDYGSSAAPYGQYSLTNNNNLLIVSDAILSYKKHFLKDFNATIRLGAADRYQYSTVLGASTSGGLQVPETYNLANSNNPVTANNSSIEKEVKSLYGTADIAYKSMVYLNVSLRNDWSSALQTPHNSFLYPSASLSLILSEMFKMPDFISYTKVRGAYSDIYYDPLAYSTLATYNSGVRWNGTPSLNLPGTLINPAITPSRTRGSEEGLEMKFLQDRLGFDFTYFNYLDDHSIQNVPLSQASGYTTLRTNGDVYNRKGIEIVLSATPVKSQDFRWDISGNYSNVHNFVKSLYGGAQQRGMIKVGDRINVDWQNPNDPNNPIYNYSGYAWERSPDGKIVYENGQPKYINQQVVLGLQEPDWEFGVSNHFTYKNFSLSFSFDGRIGGVMYDGVEAKLYEGGMSPNTANQYRDDAYAGKSTYVGNGVVVTSGSVTYDFQGKVISDTRKFAPNTQPVNYIDWVFNTYVDGIDQAVLHPRTFVKLREAVLTYTLPRTVLEKTFIKSASVSLVGRNLLLFTNVPGMDPDGYTGTTLSEPSYRNVGVNLNLKF